MEEIRSYLVQRGKFLSNSEIISRMKSGKVEGRFGYIVDLDYMGSSEFEWGALPKSLKVFREKDVRWFLFEIDGQAFSCIYTGDASKKELIEKEIRRIGAEEYPRLKEIPFFYQHINRKALNDAEKMNFKPSKYEKEPRKAYGTDFNFWWDIENHFVWFPTFYDRDITKLIDHIKIGSGLK